MQGSKVTRAFWNENLERVIVGQPLPLLRPFPNPRPPYRGNFRGVDVRLQDRVNPLLSMHGRKVFTLYSSPAVYTGKLFGVGTPLLAKDI